MAILGTGVDIVENERFQRLLEKEDQAFFNKIFSKEEIQYCDRYRGNFLKAQHYAARFAAKEALVKALGTGFRKMAFHDMEIKNDPLGAPYFSVKGSIHKLVLEKGIERIHLSLSHSDNYSIALVIVEGKEERKCE